jgi:hypothetical protein
MNRINKQLVVLLSASAIALTSWSQVPSFPVEWQNIDGWQAADDFQHFDSETLYDHINGAADFYLGYKFQELWVIPYTNDQGQALTLEVYRHADSNCAFGIYAEERPEGVTTINLGIEGFVTDGTAYCFMGDCYIKVLSGNPAPTNKQLINFTQSIAASIADTTAYPQQVGWFPAPGKIARSERFIPDKFLGLDGFDGVFTCRYENSGNKFKMFVITGEESTIEKTFTNYLAHCGAKKSSKTNQYLLKDKYNGSVFLIYQKGILAGITEHPTPKKEVALVQEVIKNAEK